MSLIDSLLESDKAEETSLTGFIDICNPKEFREAEMVVRNLLRKHATLVNIKDVDDQQRFLDFVSGAVLALGGSLWKISPQVFLFGPSNLKIERKEKVSN